MILRYCKELCNSSSVCAPAGADFVASTQQAAGWSRVIVVQPHGARKILRVDGTGYMGPDPPTRMVVAASPLSMRPLFIFIREGIVVKQSSLESLMSWSGPPRVGRVFGRLTVLYKLDAAVGKERYQCRCSCGALKSVAWKSLVKGNTKSCGCLAAEYITASKTRHPLKTTWRTMRTRCENPNHHSYKKYGAKGITVCERWASFENFLADMGEKPSSSHTLDRIDATKGYSPDNCRWADKWAQAHNRVVPWPSATIRGRTKLISEWARQFGFRSENAARLIKKGYSPELAVVVAWMRKEVSTQLKRGDYAQALYAACDDKAKAWLKI